MKLFSLIGLIAIFFVWASPVYAATPDVASFTKDMLGTFIVLASLGAIFFLVKGAYGYITSSGKPDALEHAKLTIRNAVIGLVFVLSASVISQVLTTAFTTPTSQTTTAAIALKPIVPEQPPSGLAQVMLDGINGMLKDIVQSATKPLVDGLMSFLTNTPSVLTNSVIFNFWLTMVGIADSLFVLLIALLGFHFMSASTFGFEEIEFKHLIPRIGLAFLGANSSIFLIDWIITSCNALINTVLATTGGLDHAWVLNATDLLKIVNGDALLITLIFMLLFVILAGVLLLFFIMRLITIAVGTVLAPFIFLLWALPKTADFAEISTKTFITTIYTVFVQVVIVQLASAFFAFPEQVGTNFLTSVLVGIGVLFVLLKTPSFMMQLVFYNTGRGIVKKVSGQIMNVISSKKEATDGAASGRGRTIVAPRKAVAA